MNIYDHANLSFGRGLCKDLEISAAAPHPIRVHTIETSLLRRVKFTCSLKLEVKLSLHNQ